MTNLPNAAAARPSNFYRYKHDVFHEESEKWLPRETKTDSWPASKPPSSLSSRCRQV